MTGFLQFPQNFGDVLLCERLDLRDFFVRELIQLPLLVA